jgi:hypothetical protein
MNIAMHLNAGHDRNGNPRRLWVVLDVYGGINTVFDEGYNGTGELYKNYPNITIGPELDIIPAQYKALLKMVK